MIVPSIMSIYEAVGLALTILTALVAYVRSSADSKRQNAAFVSILGVVLTLIVSIRFDLLPKLEADLMVSDTLTKDPPLLDVVKRLSEVRAKGNPPHQLMSYILDARIKAIERQFDEMSHGRFVVDEAEMPTFALAMLRTANKKITATSYVNVLKWWETPWGQQYEQLNEEKVKKEGVDITRVFIFSKTDDFRATQPLLLQESKAGVHVKYAYTDNLNYQITSDMIVIDTNLAGELRLTPDKGITEATFFTSANDISEYERRLDSVLVQAVDFSAKAPCCGSIKSGHP